MNDDVHDMNLDALRKNFSIIICQYSKVENLFTPHLIPKET